MNQLYSVKVSQRTNAGQNISIIELESTQNEPLPTFAAGAHIELHLPNAMIRQYSLCQDPEQNQRYRLAVLRDQKSRGGSQYVYDHLNLGSQLHISAPKNLFPLNLQAEHTVLIGGGIGITPLISMAYQLHHAQQSFELHYCGQHSDQAALMDELKQCAFAAQVMFHFKDQGANHRNYFKEKIKQFSKRSHLYTCGPNGFMDWIFELAKSHQFPSDQLHREVFQHDVDITGHSFQVIAKQSNKTIQVAADQSILDALASHGIYVEKSCEQGVCGTCMCDVLEGLPEHRDVYLTDEEKQSNEQILVCCSRAHSECLVLDI
ncbi:vanillate O-demethylase ferredoxin subunit [Acinetobacter calcoaceticus]|uniref:Vanillate O-demethylase ferredoxin subunit n=1 Tax=Acinetobacter calcoaceticus TaxID=471 RepID=A0A4R1XVS9_ACICA|nr:vanillate O-demethylase ferredoxin subunit [Acinetobacter calcoaceticus]